MDHLRLANRSTRRAPAWMFDPVGCAGVRLAETPLIEYAALIELAELLAQHQVLFFSSALDIWQPFSATPQRLGLDVRIVLADYFRVLR